MGTTHILNVANGAQKGVAVGPVWGEMQATWLPQGKIVYARSADPAPGASPTQNMHQALIAPGDAGPGLFVLGSGVTAGPQMDPAEFQLSRLPRRAVAPWGSVLARGLINASS